MKILRGRRAVATSNNKDKMPKCSFCKENKSTMYYTEGKKLVCHDCADKDAMEFVDEV